MIHKCLVTKSDNTVVKWNPINPMDCKYMSMGRDSLKAAVPNALYYI